jgi:hypothetical protein
MNSDDFEKSLQRQPLRQIPPKWRAEILHNACAADKQRSVANWPLLAVSTVWHELVRPARRIWVGFAFVWVAIVVVNFVDAEKPGQSEARIKIPPGNLLTVWQRQQQFLTELNNPDYPDMDKPRHSPPKPRSDRRCPEAIV